MTTSLSKRVERLVHVHGLGLMIVAIDNAGVSMRRPRERRKNAYELPWFNVHGQAARLRAAELKLDRARRRAARRSEGLAP